MQSKMILSEDRHFVDGLGKKVLEKLVLDGTKVILDSCGKKAKVVYFTAPRIVFDNQHVYKAPHWANAILVGESDAYLTRDCESKHVVAVSYYLVEK